MASLPREGIPEERLTDYLEILRIESSHELESGLLYDKTYRILAALAYRMPKLLTADLNLINGHEEFLENKPIQEYLILKAINNLNSLKRLIKNLEADNYWKDAVLALKKVLKIDAAMPVIELK